MIFQDPSLGLTDYGRLRSLRSDQIGGSAIGIGFECLDRYLFDPERTYDKLAAAGVKWARCQTGWCRCETEKGKYDFRWLDEIVDNLLRRGIQPWFNVGYGNRIYMPDAFGEAAVGSVPLYYGEETVQAWKAYVRELARRFRARVRHWEIWNEPEIPPFWRPSQPDPLEYARLIRLTAPVIRTEQGDARIGGCSSGVVTNYTVRLFGTGIAKELDFYSVHTYRIQPEKDYAREIAALRRLLARSGGAHVSIWQGEAGYASHFPIPHWLHPYVYDSQTNQAKWLLRRYAVDLAAGLEVSSYFQAVDMTARPYETATGTNKDPARHGILHGGTYEPKESYHALRHLTALFDRDTVPADLFSSVDFSTRIPWDARVSRLADVAACSAGFLRGGWPLYLYHVPEDVQLGYPGLNQIEFVCIDDAERSIENPVLVDPLRGRVFGIREFDRDAGTRVRFRKLPITDYPLILTDSGAIADRIEPRSG
jgi:polysaccharide biosynthesis protein PslG